MNNEEKILSMLQDLTTTVGTLVVKVDNLEQGQAKLEQRLDKIEQDIEIIKEDTEITRSTTNTLLDWAERVESVTEVPLFHQK